jgi:hypothetical protein
MIEICTSVVICSVSRQLEHFCGKLAVHRIAYWIHGTEPDPSYVTTVSQTKGSKNCT